MLSTLATTCTHRGPIAFVAAVLPLEGGVEQQETPKQTCNRWGSGIVDCRTSTATAEQKSEEMATRNVNLDRTATRPSMAPQGSGGAVKARQLTHLHSQLAHLSQNLSDTENLLRMTAVQAEAMRGLASWHGGMFMAASKVLGEESVKEQGQQK